MNIVLVVSGARSIPIYQGALGPGRWALEANKKPPLGGFLHVEDRRPRLSGLGLRRRQARRLSSTWPLLSGWYNAHKPPLLAFVAELDHAVDLGIEGVVTADADVGAGVELR